MATIQEFKNTQLFTHVHYLSRHKETTTLYLVLL